MRQRPSFFLQPICDLAAIAVGISVFTVLFTCEQKEEQDCNYMQPKTWLVNACGLQINMYINE